MTTFKKILVNGKEFNSLEEVPETLRHLLADQNQNGIPDVMEKIFQNPMVQKALANSGQVVSSFDQLTPEQREKVRHTFQMLGMPLPDGQAAPRDIQAQSTNSFDAGNQPSSSAKGLTSTPIDWSKIAGPSEPKSISTKTLIFLLMMIFSLLIVVWLALMFFIKK